ncbi:hypothetical protein HK098_007765 [Nowakowskiella sp. JEL0407]|nr:hypothetical protein HK098_007765 [Nowakowskiella sp. JEL0407]
MSSLAVNLNCIAFAIGITTARPKRNLPNLDNEIASKMTFWSQSYSLFVKNVILFSRNRRFFLSFLLFPVLNAVFLTYIWQSLDQNNASINITTNTNGSVMRQFEPKLLNPIWPFENSTLAFVTTESNESQQSIENVMMAIHESLSEYPFVALMKFDSLKSLDSFAKKNPTLWAAVVWESLNTSNIKYALRLRVNEGPPVAEDSNFMPSNCIIDYTLCYSTKYVDSGLLWFQKSVDNAIVKEVLKNRPNLGVERVDWVGIEQFLSARQFIHVPPAKEPSGSRYLIIFMGTSGITSLLFVLVPWVMDEKEKKVRFYKEAIFYRNDNDPPAQIRELMFLQGLKPISWHFSWDFTIAFLTLIPSIVITLLFTNPSSFLPFAPFLTFLIFLIICHLANSAFSTVLSIILSKARTATIIASLYSAIGPIVIVLIEGLKPDIFEKNSMLLMLLTVVFYPLGIGYIYKAESTGNLGKGFRLIELFKRSGNGFPALIRKTKATPNNRTSSQTNVLSASDIQPDPVGLDVLVDIKNIGKVYDELVALDNVSMKMYQGEIFALLGANGAGKTTLLNILTGITPPTTGDALICSNSITTNIDEVRQQVGVVLQQDVVIPTLDIYEHVWVWAKLKGVICGMFPRRGVWGNEVIDDAIEEVEMSEKVGVDAVKLSGGEKRKLNIAMAVVGKPKIVILDEPSSGLDPGARRHLWTILSQNKSNRLVIFTTHQMDEADFLADRKAIIQHGRLKCIGTSIFLKSLFNLNYVLEITFSQSEHTRQHITNTVKQYAKDAVEKGFTHNADSTALLKFDLGNENSASFGDLFEALENSKFIEEFGVFMPNLEEVFLKTVKDDNELENSHQTALTNELANESNSTWEQLPQSSTFQNLFVLTKFYIINQFRNWGSVFQLVFGPSISWTFLVLYLLFISKFMITAEKLPNVSTQLGYLSFSQSPKYYKDLSAVFGSDPELNLYPSLRLPEIDFETVNLEPGYNRPINFTRINDPVHRYLNYTFVDGRLGGFAISLNRDVQRKTAFVRTIGYSNVTYTHAPSMLMNLMSNSLMRTLVGDNHPNIEAGYSTLPLVTEERPIDEADKYQWMLVLSIFAAIEIPMLLCYTNLFFVTGDYIRERNLGLELQLILNGVSPVILGIAAFLNKAFTVTIGALAVSCSLYLAPKFLFGVSLTLLDGEWVPLVVLTHVLFGFSTTSMGIFLSLFFKTPEGPRTLTPLIFPTMILLPGLAIFRYNIHNLMSILNPLYPPFGILGMLILTQILELADFKVTSKEEITSNLWKEFGVSWLRGAQYLSSVQRMRTGNATEPPSFWENESFGPVVPLVAMVFHTVLFLTIVIVFPNPATKVGNWFAKLWEPKIPSGEKKRDSGDGSEEEQPLLRDNVANEESEDEDVKHEKERIMGGESAEDFQVRDVYKVFRVNKGANRKAEEGMNTDDEELDAERRTSRSGCWGRTKDAEDEKSKQERNLKIAVGGVSFGFSRGKIFALLGPNGAGKSTVISMMVGQIPPTKGEIQLRKQYSPTDTTFREILGYCSQNDVLWPKMTILEHIELMSQLRFVNSERLQSQVLKLVRDLGVDEFKDVWTERLSGGNKRKVVYALAVSGEREIIILDEPSTGLDPNSRKLLWNSIKSEENRMTLLTSHSLEEIDALSSNISIMINGKLKCIGTSQHLKSRFGQHFILELVIPRQNGNSDSSKYDKLVQTKFSNALRSDSFDAVYRWNILVTDVKATLPNGEPSTYHVEEQFRSKISLSKVFRWLENLKLSGDIEGYSFAQPTLEQVFLKIAKNQKE